MELIQANRAFLKDLEAMLSPEGYRAVGGVGDVALKHVSGIVLYIQTVERDPRV